jgi:Ser/Thr protein kinase RdoA (MazF antagonist)
MGDETGMGLGNVAPQLLAFAQAQAGALTRAEYRGWDHGVSDVWECWFEAGHHLFLKRSVEPGKFEQELRAYRAWTPHLGDLCPDLVAADEDERALLVTALPGALAEDLELTRRAEAELHRQAGAFLRAFHGLPHVDDEVALADAIQMRAERWSARAALHVDASARDWMMARIREIAPMLDGVRRTPCHRDFTPRNWVIDEDSNLRVIDFGHTRPDFWALDIDKLWSDQWVERRDRSDAFWDGYGRKPSDDEWAVVEAAGALSAITTIAWSRARLRGLTR